MGAIVQIGIHHWIEQEPIANVGAAPRFLGKSLNAATMFPPTVSTATAKLASIQPKLAAILGRLK
jgi:hypothetical protein